MVREELFLLIMMLQLLSHFMETLQYITFAGNQAFRDGAAIFGYDNSLILFDGENTSVAFVGNVVGHFVGAIYGFYITLNGSGTVTFTENHGVESGTIFVQYGHIRFDGSTLVTFVNNVVDGPGTITLSSSNLTFTGNTSDSVIFNDNRASNGGAIYGFNSSVVSGGNASVVFVNNKVFVHSLGELSLGELLA